MHSSSKATAGSDQLGLTAFRDGKAHTLVASDALTRGMDMPGIDVVINYDPAAYPKTYVHRAGRTARAGKPGKLDLTDAASLQLTLQRVSVPLTSCLLLAMLDGISLYWLFLYRNGDIHLDDRASSTL